MQSIYNLSIEDLKEYFIGIGDKKYKAIQLYEWLYNKKIASFDDITNIKKEVLDKLKKSFNLEQLNIIDSCNNLDTTKYLFELKDSNKIEAVLMKHNYGNSLCISTQVGCNMGCKFCESGRLKKVRNLETYEMVLQILEIEKLLNERVSHLVLMGIGEPFDNYDNVIKLIDIINNPKGLALGSRHITISTCGVIPKIKEFMNYDKQVNLAISLHAPSDKIRNNIMAINKVYPIKDLIDVVKKYIEKTNRRVTFEYIMLKEVNDSETDALELSKLLKGINCYVNLIPYNETSHIEFKKSDEKSILKFYDVLKKNNINVTIRREFGSNLNAACGQLRANYEEEN